MDPESTELGAGAGRRGGAGPSPQERVPGPTRPVVWKQLQVKVAPAACSLPAHQLAHLAALSPLRFRRCPAGRLPGPCSGGPGAFVSWRFPELEAVRSLRQVCGLGEKKPADLVVWVWEVQLTPAVSGPALGNI